MAWTGHRWLGESGGPVSAYNSSIFGNRFHGFGNLLLVLRTWEETLFLLPVALGKQGARISSRSGGCRFLMRYTSSGLLLWTLRKIIASALNSVPRLECFPVSQRGRFQTTAFEERQYPRQRQNSAEPVPSSRPVIPGLSNHS